MSAISEILYALTMLPFLPHFTLHLPYSYTQPSLLFPPITLRSASILYPGACLFVFASCINSCLGLTIHFTGFFARCYFLPPLFLHSFFILLQSILKQFFSKVLWLVSFANVYFYFALTFESNGTGCKTLNLNSFSLKTLNLLSHCVLASRSVRTLIFIWFSFFCK